MAISRQTVLHIAELANLRLDESEVDSLERDLAKIVAYVEELNELDTSNVPPTVQMASGFAARPDEVLPGLGQARALSEAPRTIEGGFAVPGFVEET